MTPRDLDLPFDTFRPGQFDLAMEIAGSDKRFVVVSAPTGTGKSLMYVAAAKLLGARTLVLTGTKGLQDQLVDDFGEAGMVDIRGHGNYSCSRGGGGELPPLVLFGKPFNESGGGGCRLRQYGECEYDLAVHRACEADLVVTSYAYWLTRARMNETDLLGQFDLLVLDEAHRADEWLSRQCKWVARYDDAHEAGLEFPDTDDVGEWVEWAKEHQSEYPKLQEITRAVDKGVGWVVERTASSVNLTPVWAHPWAESALFRGVGKVVLTSATLFKHTGKYLGLEDDEVDYIEADSPFPRENRPFIHLPGVRVQHNITEGQKRLWINKIDTWIGDRLDRKGIIHSISYARAREIKERSRYSDLMIVHRPGEVSSAVEDFKSREVGVLVSPAVSEGFDFPGDLCEWQVISKVPFVYTKDPLTQARQKDDKLYGMFLAAQAVIQMAGRAVRSAEDKAETAIADDHWRWFSKKVVWPRWFKSGWVR